MKYDTQKKWWVVLGVVVVVSALGYCQPPRQAVTCPVNSTAASTAAKLCLAKTRVSLAPSAGITTYAKLKEGCTSGSLVEVVECLNDILRSCDAENPEISKTLRLHHNVDLLDAAIKRVCDNLDMIARSHCSQKKFLKHKVCLRQKGPDTVARIVQYAKVQPERLLEMFNRLSCEYHYAVLSSCMKKTLHEENCGEAVRSLFLTLPRATIPPYCNMANSQNNTTVPATTVSPSTVETTVSMSENEALKNGVPKSRVQTVNSGKEPIIVQLFMTICLVIFVILENFI